MQTAIGTCADIGFGTGSTRENNECGIAIDYIGFYMGTKLGIEAIKEAPTFQRRPNDTVR